MSVEPYKKQYLTLGIALAGVYATAPNEWSDTSAQVTIYDSRLIPYLGELVEGGMVMDKRRMDRTALINGVVSGPMLKESLTPGCKEVCIVENYLISRRDHVKVESLDELHGFDFIALDVYLSYWRKLGARIGKRVGDTIQWEDGEMFPIPPVQFRYLHPNGMIRSRSEEIPAKNE